MSEPEQRQPYPPEEHQPASGGSMRQDSTDSAKANTRHGLARQGAHPQSCLRLSATIDESM
jgi:hypothetical protein